MPPFVATRSASRQAGGAALDSASDGGDSAFKKLAADGLNLTNLGALLNVQARSLLQGSPFMFALNPFEAGALKLVEVQTHNGTCCLMLERLGHKLGDRAQDEAVEPFMVAHRITLPLH